MKRFFSLFQKQLGKVSKIKDTLPHPVMENSILFGSDRSQRRQDVVPVCVRDIPKIMSFSSILKSF